MGRHGSGMVNFGWIFYNLVLQRIITLKNDSASYILWRDCESRKMTALYIVALSELMMEEPD